MNNKLNFEKLVDWVEGRLSNTEAEQVSEQIAADKALQADVDWIRTFHKVSDQTVWEAPPVEVRGYLSNRFAAYAAQNRPPTLWERLVATLKYDSQLQLATAGFRSAASPTERQLVYQTDRADVALTIQQHPPDELFSIMGHILPIVTPTPNLYSVQLLQGAFERGFTATDEIGEFVFEGLPKGVYELAIHHDQYEMVISLQLTL